jgi:hypothetical protein
LTTLNKIPLHLVTGEVLAACDPNMPLNSTKRVQHLYKIDKTECSLRKDAAGVVKRIIGGWLFLCYRCGESARIPDDFNPTKERTKSKLEAAKQMRAKNTRDYGGIVLPHDYIKFLSKASFTQGCGNTHFAGKNWLAAYGLTSHDWDTYDIGWSDAYTRIIIPIYDPLTDKLVGWVGRDPYIRSKEHRVKEHMPKWLTKKDHSVDRIVFVSKGSKDDTRCFIVEDVISAIKVREATGIATVALLTTSIATRVMEKLPYTKLIFWLDRDAYRKAIGHASRYRALGYEVRTHRSAKDPKEYTHDEIKNRVKSLLDSFK